MTKFNALELLEHKSMNEYLLFFIDVFELVPNNVSRYFDVFYTLKEMNS